jgi:hypothetical protein
VSRRIYKARAVLDDSGWYAITVRGFPDHTAAVRAVWGKAGVESMAREAVAAWAEVEEGSFDLEIEMEPGA